MRSLPALLGAVLLGLASLAASGARAADYKSGTHYLTLPEAQNTDAANKVEVTEFFAYYCPHCARFEASLQAWAKNNAASIVFRRVHVSGGGAVAVQQRIFYTLDALGIVEANHQKAFDAIHVERNRLATEEAAFEWAQKAGIDRARFVEAWNSFGVQAKLRRANAMMAAYRVDYWPVVAIDGRFMTSPSLAGEADKALQTEEQMQQGALQVMDFLVAKAKAEKK
ncbi:thiol:disulfide interchange protein DsbA/DsbL [Massilia sp. DWR3-1-1]|uniref:thiol:disulfide interchange protein DsbA/DsbL n=1 Tax=Massilia sp. DWR3-1-1 TaxID=2804559 RepID=UPI003CF8DE09